DVHAHARRLLLAELDLEGYEPSLPPALVVSLLILASIWQTSLSCACCMVKDPPCRERARTAALALLPRKPTELLAALLRALHTRWGRFTVGLLPTRPKMRLTTVVEALLGQAKEAGLALAYVLMDKEFYAAEVIDLSQRRGLPFIVPVEERRGAAASLFDRK